MEVTVTAVPIVVASTTADYFVVYVRHDLDADTVVELPVLVKLGEAGTTTLAENIEALPKERYRVEQYLIADPADVDGDCLDDLTELNALGSMNPVNPAPAIDISDGTLAVPDRETFERLSYQGTLIDTYLADLEVVKFVLAGLGVGLGNVQDELPRVYFQNTETHQLHSQFENAVGLSQIEPFLRFFGSIVYHPRVVAPDGSLGVYSVRLWSSLFSCSSVDLAYTALAASMPLLRDNLVFYVPPIALPNYQDELACYEASRIPLVFDAKIAPETGTGFLALNSGEGYGLLRHLDLDDRPHPRDIVIYEALPNELPRVAGIITTVPQTPLSHVNLRAAQDGIPNASIRDVLDDPDTAPLIGGFVRYEVTGGGWEIRAATPDASRQASADPATVQLTVLDGDPPVEVSFGQGSYTVHEGGTATVQVRLNTDPERTVVILLETTLQGATTADYAGVPSSVTFSPGETMKEITVTATDDDIDDDDETIELSFGTLPPSVSKGSPGTATVTIADNDEAVKVSFGAATYAVTEGWTVDVVVRLDVDPERTVTIPVEASSDAPGDYSIPGSVTFHAGETQKPVNFVTVDDSEVESDDMFGELYI